MSDLEARMCREHFTALPCCRCGSQRVTLESLPGNDDNWLRDRWLSGAKEALEASPTPDLLSEWEGEKETKG